MEQENTKTLNHISRENMGTVLKEANEREIKQEDSVCIVSKGNSFYLVYVE